jgi:putative DNA primase/helicase
MGDYSGVANPNTVMQQKYGDTTVQYQLAELTSVRFVGMSETKREVKLEESIVKQITGNDTISARSLISLTSMTTSPSREDQPSRACPPLRAPS